MIVLSDTSPIHYLVLIGHVDILPAIFGEVIVPTAVFDELQRPSTPESVRQWAAAPPPWFKVRSAARIDESLQLGHGETEAISLAIELGADLLLMDDRKARRAAESHGLSVAGTINVLEAAAQRNLLELPLAIQKLRSTNFHISEQILARALSEDAKRRKE